MRKLVLPLVVLTWILAACAGPTSPAAETAGLPGTGTQPVQPATAAPAVDLTVEPTVQTNAAPAASATAGVTETIATDEAAASQGGAAGSGTVVFSMVPEESTVTYEVGETFINQGNVFNVAVGKTPGVTGDITVNFDRPQETSVGTMTVDISGLTSDSGRRDNAIRDRFLQSAQFPTVTFTPTTIDGLPEKIEPGVEYPLTLQGDLTIRDTTKPATFDAKVTWQDDSFTGQATTSVLMSDYGFGPIDILGTLKTQDEVKITLDFVARPK